VKTETFLIKGSRWQITYETASASGVAEVVKISVYTASGRFVTDVTKGSGEFLAAAVVTRERGEFYLDIGQGADTWEITVHDWY
jgi:hypothetical protein